MYKKCVWVPLEHEIQRPPSMNCAPKSNEFAPNALHSAVLVYERQSAKLGAQWLCEAAEVNAMVV